MSLQSWPGLLRLQDWEWTVSLFGHWRLGLMDIPWASSCVHCVHVSLSWGMQLPDSPIKGGVKYSITGMPLWPSGWFFFGPRMSTDCDPDAVERSLGAGPGTEMNRQMRRRRHQAKGRNFYILLLQLSCHDVMFGSKAMTHEFFENVSRCLRCVGLNKLKFFRSARSGKWSENSASGKWGANSTTSNKWGANSSSGNKFGKSGSNIWNSASGRQYSNTGQPNWCFNELVGIHAISLS